LKINKSGEKMDIFKVLILSSLTISTLFAKIDFVKFDDICIKTSSVSCKNNPLEIKAVQYILKKRLNSDVKITGKLDTLTKEAIVALQLKEHIPASGYIGKNTKDALNKLLYGKRLHDTTLPAKKEIKLATDSSNNKSLLKSKKSVKKVIAKKGIKAKKLNKLAKKSLKKIKIEPKIAKVKVKKVKNKKKLIRKKVALKVKNKKLIAKISKKKLATKGGKFRSYREFKKSVNVKSYAIYQDSKLLKRAGGRNTLLKVDVSEQRVKLVVNGKVALDAPCTTGAKHKFEPNSRTYRDKRTPLGTFRVIEKIATKRSTIFGNIYRNGKLIYHGDRRKYRGSWSGVKFVGAPLRNWMRLTSSGIGLHASDHVKRYAGSNGCIRLQPKVASTLFRKLRAGTTVKVVN
jgi:lipoprotein-anchoring transpeptidase ErfK/SrfK